MKSKLEQFNLLDEAGAEGVQPREHGEQTYSIPLSSSHHPVKLADDLTEQPDTNGAPEYLAQNEEGDENPTSEGLDQTTTERQSDDVDSGVPAVDSLHGGESSNEAELEQVQPADDEESTADPLLGEEDTEQPVGTAEDDRDQGTAAATALDSGYPGPTEELDATAVHEHSDNRNTPPLGGNSTEYEEVAVTNEDYEADYNETEKDSEPGETVTIESDARDGDWETTASDPQHAQDDLEQHEDQHDVVGADKREQVVCITAADDLTPSSADSDTIDLTDPRFDDGPIVTQQGRCPPLPLFGHRLTLP